jgi:small subunit ribosomal protein S8
MMTDPIADMLTRIRNALLVKHASVHIPHSRVKKGIVEVLKREGYVEDFEEVERMGRRSLLVHLRYHRGQQPVIEGIERVSKPGRRVYANTSTMPKVRNGLGVAILTTSKGIMTDGEARDAGIGGEVICNVW